MLVTCWVVYINMYTINPSAKGEGRAVRIVCGNYRELFFFFFGVGGRAAVINSRILSNNQF